MEHSRNKNGFSCTTFNTLPQTKLVSSTHHLCPCVATARQQSLFDFVSKLQSDPIGTHFVYPNPSNFSRQALRFDRGTSCTTCVESFSLFHQPIDLDLCTTNALEIRPRTLETLGFSNFLRFCNVGPPEVLERFAR